MAALTIMENTAVAQQVQEAQNVTNYFTDFVSWIDRPEKTTRTYLNNLKQFAAWMIRENIKQPEREDIISYRQYLTDKGLKPATVKAYMQTVKAFFSWTAAAGIYPNVASNIHTPKVSQDRHKKEALDAGGVVAIENSIMQRSAQQVQEAQEAAKDKAGKLQRATEQGKRLFAIYLLAVNAGLRTVEISRLNVEDFTIHGGQAWIYICGKGHAEADYKKAIAPEVAAAVKDYLQSRADKPTAKSPLFVSTGNRSGGQRIATTTISTMLKKAMQEAGYDDPRITAHSLRHTAGNSVMNMSGNNIYAAQLYMRHSSPKTTEIYLHTDEQAQDAQTAADLYRYYHAQQEGGGLDDLLNKLSPLQLQQLAGIAAAMA